MKYLNIKIFSLLVMVLLLPFTGFAAITVDGRVDEPDWESAQSFSDFVVIDPLTLAEPRFATRALLLSTEDGLAVAFICEQSEEGSRTRTVAKRDASKFDADSVSFMVDFDGIGEIAYEFSVSISGSYRDGNIVNEVKTNYDWDCLWQRAVNEEVEQWTVEILLPWSIVAMREHDGETRRIGISFQRRFNASNEIFAFPDASISRSRFISDFAEVEVKRYTSQEFYVVPYATVLSDLIKNNITGKAGLDLFWKPSGRFQLAATMNPDFGQVESDDLVINFSAIETLFSDKRPFFTENQGIFDSVMPIRYRLFYTRRVGGPDDRDGGAGDINAAVKAIGSAGLINYGAFAASEANEEGRDFYAGRVVFPINGWSLGALSTYVKRPFREKTALVNSFDYHFKFKDVLRVQGVLIKSEIDSKNVKSSGYGVFNVNEYYPNDRWTFIATFFYLDEKVDFSDMGYQQRNDLKEYFLKASHRKTDFSQDSRAASVTWSGIVTLPKNTEGERLPGFVSLNRSEKMRSGADLSATLQLTTNGYDDLISRGSGPVWLDERWSLDSSYSTQRDGIWGKSFRLNIFQEGMEGWAAGAEANVTWYPHEEFNLNFRLNPQWSRDWLIWMRDVLFGKFSRRQVTAGITANWFPAERHEVLIRCQWITLDADALQPYRIGEESRLVPSDDSLNDFARINFATQLRYRYEVAPMSDLYVVYSRGGLDAIDNPTKGIARLVAESTSLRDADQLLVKLSYRF
ncbi:MAG: hypothetical protein JW944_10305 [Deltaproteobacteria bacterium]|nr:hypothetical protein [Deltaproteobacteria bacterium]